MKLKLKPSETVQNINETCDVVVVGSGAGGSVVAKELAEIGLSVVLLEEGGYYKVEDFQKQNTVDSLIHLFRDAGTTTLVGKPNVIYVEGRCVGGSTTVNGGVCWRTPEKILKRWQWEKGLEDLSPKKMEYYFDRVEKIISVSDVHPESMNNDSLIIKAGAEKLGYRVKANQRNHENCVGMNQCITGCPSGGKKPPIMNYIPHFLKSGGQLLTHCRVLKIMTKNNKAVGVSGVIQDPETKKKKAKFKINSRVVVVCGGAIQSPALLKRSGIPDESELLGKNLFAHPNTKVMGVFENPVEAWKGVNQAFQITEFIDEGILMSVNFVPPSIFALALPFYGERFISAVRDMYHHCVLGAALIEDTSRGVVKNLPFNQTIATYQLNKRDFQLALRATALLAEIYFAAGAKTVYLPLKNLHEINTVDDIRKIFEYNVNPSDLELMTVHIMGTCQMGSDPKLSVVNPFGEMHSTRGLFVADASVFPSSIGVNPQETIMALATRTAFYIAENMSRF